ncbi:hypothetical protein ACHQM5_021026 [Ranunculus cassubicifolius]
MSDKPIEIRQVWQKNLRSEFKLIQSIIDRFSFISMDTEFPGVIIRPTGDFRRRTPADNYFTLKSNVDALNLIQVGLSLTDSSGNLPDLGSENRYIWEFNFKDFDIVKDAYALESIELLKRQGMDFERNRLEGIDSCEFAELMMSSGLICNDAVSWITFHSAYDFGYLVKIFTCNVLPGSITEFLTLLRIFFGKSVYDVKHIMGSCGGLYGGLNQIAKILQVERVVGKCHQAGSDSLLTWHAFQQIRDIYFAKDGLAQHAGFLYGL